MSERHYSDAELAQYAAQALPKAESLWYEEHLAGCQHCTDRLAEFAQLEADLRQTLRAAAQNFEPTQRVWQPKQPVRPARKPSLVWRAAPAMLVMLLMTAALVWFITDGFAPGPVMPLNPPPVVAEAGDVLPHTGFSSGQMLLLGGGAVVILVGVALIARRLRRDD